MDKRISIISAIIIVLITTSVVAVCALTDNASLKTDTGIYIIDNQIVYNNRVLTSTSDTKWFPKLSPDGKKIAFCYDMDFTKDKWGKVGIVDIETGEITDIYSDVKFANSYIDLEWLNNNKIGALGHRNPTLSTYEIFDVNKSKYVESYYGSGFCWDSKKSHIYYTKQMPIFSGVKGSSKIMMDDEKIIYEADSSTQILGAPSVSDNDDLTAFFERDLLSDDIYIVTASMGDDRKLTASKKIKWNNELGKIKWVDSKNLKIESRFLNTEFNIDSEKITKTSEIKNEKVLKIDDARDIQLSEPFVIQN